MYILIQKIFTSSPAWNSHTQRGYNHLFPFLQPISQKPKSNIFLPLPPSSEPGFTFLSSPAQRSNLSKIRNIVCYSIRDTLFFCGPLHSACHSRQNSLGWRANWGNRGGNFPPGGPELFCRVKNILVPHIIPSGQAPF